MHENDTKTTPFECIDDTMDFVLCLDDKINFKINIIILNK